MSNGQGPNLSYDNLSHSAIMKLYSKDDKNVTGQIDVWGGTTSFVVFTGQGGGKPWKQTLPRKVIKAMVVLLKKMKAAPRPQRQAIMLNVFDPEARKMKQLGQIAFGLDESLMFFIEVAHNDLQGRHTFPVKPDGKFDFSNTEMTEKDHLEAILDYVIDVLDVQTAHAERMTSFKRAPGGFGGNRGGGNNNRGGYGNNQGGGGGYNQNQNRQPPSGGGTFGGGVEMENDLAL